MTFNFKFAGKYLLLLGLIFAAFAAIMIFTPGIGFAADADGLPNTSSELVLDATQTWVVVIGALVPLATYVLNKYAPWVSEAVKGFVLVAVSGLVAALYVALDGGTLGFNSSTVQLVASSIVASLVAHSQFYTRAGWSQKLGGGQNVQDR